MPETADLLYKTYNKLGEIYYFKRNDYGKAAKSFEKAKRLTEKDNLLQISEEEKFKLTERVAAAFYKAKNYDKASKYYSEHLGSLTDGIFMYSKLDNNFIDKIVNNNNQEKSEKIATALEMLGVTNVKNKQFQSAILCFQTSLGIRKIVNGNKMETAHDLKALSRLAMIAQYSGNVGKAFNLFNFNGSKELLEQSIEIMKNELGSEHPDVKKEEKFKNDYFGVNFASGLKPVTRLWGSVKGSMGYENKFVKEIVDDFHLIYEDLKICE